MFKSRYVFSCWKPRKYVYFKKYFYKRHLLFFKTKKKIWSREAYSHVYLLRTKNLVRFDYYRILFTLYEIYPIISKMAVLNLAASKSVLSFFLLNSHERLSYFSFLKNFVSKKPLFVKMRVVTSKSYIGGRKTKDINLDFFFKKNNLGLFKNVIGPSNKKQYRKDYQLFYRWLYSMDFSSKIIYKKQRLTDFLVKLYDEMDRR